MANKLAGTLALILCANPAHADDVILLAADEVNRAEECLRSFVAQNLEAAFDLDCKILTPDAAGHFEGIDALDEAELLVVFTNDHKLVEGDMTSIKAYISRGQPIVVIRSGCHGFEGWREFNEDYVGANYLGAWTQHEPPSVRLTEKARHNPVVAELDLAEFQAHGPLYRVLPLASTATPLLMGRVAGLREAEPVAWTNATRGASIFVTTLGTPEDFGEPVFREMLKRATLWCLGRRNLDGDEETPILDESNSVSIFDGKSLGGWTTHGGRYDGNARWTVEGGVMVGRQGPDRSGGLLYTKRPYKNFILSFETQIDYPFDSGVFLRMAPKGGGKGIQVTLDYRPNGQIGGIYADGFLKQKPDSTDLLKRGEWNRVVVRCIDDDMHVTAWLNDKLLNDYETPAKSEDFAPTGLIGVQVHGGENAPESQRAMFRELRIRELPHYDSSLYLVDNRGILSLTAAGEAAGWKSLFNGEDLSGWDPRLGPGTYRVEAGELVLSAGSVGEIRSVNEYRDFELRLDFQISRMANSGLFLRAAPDGAPSYSGCEIQILDDFNWETVTESTLEPDQFTGSLYGALAPRIKTAMRPLGDWNTYQVRYLGSQLSVRLNGYLLFDVDTHTLEADPPFAERAARGSIGLLRQVPSDVKGDFARFRNLFVREIGS